MILTYKYRVKDATARKRLKELAANVNMAWNRLAHEQHTVQSHYAVIGPNLPWPHVMRLRAHFSGHSADCGLHSDTLSEIARVFAVSRTTHKKCPKRRGRKALGWIPFLNRSVQCKGQTVKYLGRPFKLWLSRPLGGPIKTGQFVCDARGRWSVCFQCEVPETTTCGTGAVGIDLGCSTLATLSTGETVENPKWVAKYENQLAIAQRAHHKKRVQAIHAKTANSRRHRLHVASRQLVRQYGHIVVGDVNARVIAQTRLGKSSLDASWTAFRTMLRYKCQQAGAQFEEVSERYSTQTCSSCHARSGPKGIASLGIRSWVCGQCRVSHNRDTNAALNILSGAERRPLAEEIPAL